MGCPNQSKFLNNYCSSFTHRNRNNWKCCQNRRDPDSELPVLPKKFIRDSGEVFHLERVEHETNKKPALRPFLQILSFSFKKIHFQKLSHNNFFPSCPSRQIYTFKIFFPSFTKKPKCLSEKVFRGKSITLYSFCSNCSTTSQFWRKRSFFKIYFFTYNSFVIGF